MEYLTLSNIRNIVLLFLTLFSEGCRHQTLECNRFKDWETNICKPYAIHCGEWFAERRPSIIQSLERLKLLKNSPDLFDCKTEFIIYELSYESGGCIVLGEEIFVKATDSTVSNYSIRDCGKSEWKHSVIQMRWDIFQNKVKAPSRRIFSDDPLGTEVLVSIFESDTSEVFFFNLPYENNATNNFFKEIEQP